MMPEAKEAIAVKPRWERLRGTTDFTVVAIIQGHGPRVYHCIAMSPNEAIHQALDREFPQGTEPDDFQVVCVITGHGIQCMIEAEREYFHFFSE